MNVEKNKVVAVSYELEVEGKIADKAKAESPLEYIHGTGTLLPRFESELEGKQPGDSFEFTLSPEEGYGEYDEAYKVDVPKSAFEVDGKLREDLLVPGYTIPMFNSEGQVVQGMIVEVKPESVSMDFNHPMAGKSLHFTGKVESVRDATDKELLEGLHGEYLPKEGCHCGGGCCGSEGEGCCGEGGGHCNHEGEGHCHHDGEGHCHHEGEGRCGHDGKGHCRHEAKES